MASFVYFFVTIATRIHLDQNLNGTIKLPILEKPLFGGRFLAVSLIEAELWPLPVMAVSLMQAKL